ncbi:MAG TPA: Holliday junction branch migration protein RuvA [Methylothermaceae bacterium]|nr:Holliday junction branch migration protein RuvA [Methylothermaceae bacterium]
MIGFLRGVLTHKHPPSLLLDVGGVGYEVDAPMSTFYQLPDTGSEVMLHTHLVIREDAHVLFGFATESERTLFRALIRITGIGPRLGLAILSGLSPDEFQRCIQQGDVTALQRLPGIGKKTAERLIIEMRDRPPDTSSGEVVTEGSADPLREASEALIALGYKPQEAERLLHQVKEQAAGVEELIRLALKQAGGR